MKVGEMVMIMIGNHQGRMGRIVGVRDGDGPISVYLKENLEEMTGLVVPPVKPNYYVINFHGESEGGTCYWGDELRAWS